MTCFLLVVPMGFAMLAFLHRSPIFDLLCAFAATKHMTTAGICAHSGSAGQALFTKLPQRLTLADVAPDIIRLHNPMPSQSMKCDQVLPPESMLTTSIATHQVSIYATSVYRGLAHQESGSKSWQHSWGLEVEISNEGSGSLQLLTRHVVVTDAGGLVKEMKLPGAFGKTPILPPGERFTARSNALLETGYGALHGSYQFEVLSGPDIGRAFSANLGRLMLSNGTYNQNPMPCAREADVLARELPTTSVFNSHRVIAGVTASHVPTLSDADLFRYVYMYDLQIQNARDHAIVVHGHEWNFLDARGVLHTENGIGLGGTDRTGKVKIPAGRGTRHRGTFELPTSTGIASARFVVTFDGDGDYSTVEILVAPFGVSVNNEPVRPIERATFLTEIPESNS